MGLFGPTKARQRETAAAEYALSVALRHGKVEYVLKMKHEIANTGFILGPVFNNQEVNTLVSALDRREDDFVADDIAALIKHCNINASTFDRLARKMVAQKQELLGEIFRWKFKGSLELWREATTAMLEVRSEGASLYSALRNGLRADIVPPIDLQTYARAIMDISLERGDDTTLFDTARLIGAEVTPAEKESLLFNIMNRGDPDVQRAAFLRAAAKAI